MNNSGVLPVLSYQFYFIYLQLIGHYLYFADTNRMCVVFLFFQRNLILQYFKPSISSNLALPLFLSVTLFPYGPFQLLINSLNAFWHAT